MKTLADSGAWAVSCPVTHGQLKAALVSTANKDSTGLNVLDSEAAYKGRYDRFDSPSDPMVGERVGGTITFGGGLGLYSGGTIAVGGLGLSGDTACADHSTAWRTRANLKLAPKPGIGFDTITLGTTAHPHCPNDVGTQGQTP